MFWRFFHAFLFLEVFRFYSQSLSSLLRDFDWFNLFFLKFFHVFPSGGDSCHLTWQEVWVAFPNSSFVEKLLPLVKNLLPVALSQEGICIPSLFWYVPRRHQHLDCCGHTSHAWMLSAWSHWSVDLLNRRSWCLGTWLYIAFWVGKTLTLHTQSNVNTYILYFSIHKIILNHKIIWKHGT